MGSRLDRIVINFDEITSNYESGLVDKLRHFGLEGEFLETWVPDPNPVKSVINLADSAAEAELGSAMELRLPRQTIEGKILDDLVGQLMKTLDVAVDNTAQHTIIVLSGFDKVSEQSLRGTAPDITAEDSSDLDSTKAVTRASIPKAHLSCVIAEPVTNSLYDQQSPLVMSHRTKLQSKKGWCLLEDEHDGILFQVQVDLDSHLIESAAFGGDVPAPLEALLEQFCALITGLPILEAADHGVARLEFALRGGYSKRSVQGIVLPGTVDQRFALLQAVIRNILSEYRRIASYSNVSNDYDIGPSDFWLDCSDQERKHQLQAVYASILGKMGLSSTEIEILDIEYDVRVLVRLSGQLAKLETDKQALLMDLEQAMAEQIDERLELYLEPIRDISTLRRMTPDN